MIPVFFQSNKIPAFYNYISYLFLSFINISETFDLFSHFYCFLSYFSCIFLLNYAVIVLYFPIIFGMLITALLFFS